ncbi:hypothetical protein, partial [Bacillus cereus]|nr:hypothetical protein [Bacillus cereus]
DTDRTVLMYRVMLFSHLLRDRLRQQSHIYAHYQAKVQLTAEQWQVLATHINPPQYLLELTQKDLAVLYKRGEISDIIYSMLT